MGYVTLAERAARVTRGHSIINCDGYRHVYLPLHPRVKASTPYIAEHRVVVERKVGRLLEPGECVHHLNGDKLDNRPENLEVMPISEHARMHMRGNKHGCAGVAA